MPEKLYTTYGLNGEPESRLERELDNIYRIVTDAQLEKKIGVPNLSMVTERKPFLAQVGGNWYIYVKIEGAYFKTALTAA
jgi:hypothetical protein